MENTYVMNKETGKIELYFNKSDYMALSEDEKKEIKNNFLFSRKLEAWVSRTKFPNLYRAEAVAKKLGLVDGGKIGEQLTFAEQMEIKAMKAEVRAERYDYKAGKAIEKGKVLQQPINDVHGDISFFTQPNINNSACRAFTHKREKMIAAWERGFEEFKKSEYYAKRAEIARQTAEQTKPTDKGFIDRRIKDAEKTIRAQKKNLENYQITLKEIESGKVIKRYNGDIMTADTVKEWIEDTEMSIEAAISKSIYYHECMEEVGGVAFSKDNIQVGYIVDIDRWGKCKVTGTGKINITYEILTGGATGLGGKASYAEIKKIISTEIEKSVAHPFKVGDVYTVEVWNPKTTRREPKEYTVTKVTNERVTLKSGEERAINRKPRRFRNGANAFSWALGIVDGHYGTIYIPEKATV